jgi:hypothetical protein
MEVTAYLAEKASSISCIDITAVPFERVLGVPVGKMLQSVSHRKRFTTSLLHIPNSQGYDIIDTTVALPFCMVSHRDVPEQAMELSSTESYILES